jgi:deoxyribodipyrimidine photolyase-related protein
MDSAAVVFPHQLFCAHPCLKPDRIIYLAEDPWFFGDPGNQLGFHRQKLVLHRAGLQAYRDFLASRGHLVRCLEFTSDRGGYLWDRLKKNGGREIVACEPVERGLTDRLVGEAEAAGLKLNFLATPMFLWSAGEIEDFFQGKGKFHRTRFYIWQRRRWDILGEGGKPLRGRWTCDPLNRRKLP